MTEFNAESVSFHTAASAVEPAASEAYAAYVGLDVHKETIAIAIAEPGRQEPVCEGEIANTPKRMERKIQRLSGRYGGGLLQFVYEAGPCGYGLYRQLLASGHDAQVVAPSRIPKAPGERIKTDRRDALKLARLARSSRGPKSDDNAPPSKSARTVKPAKGGKRS